MDISLSYEKMKDDKRHGIIPQVDPKKLEDAFSKFKEMKNGLS
jgi:hypothetical protein